METKIIDVYNRLTGATATLKCRKLRLGEIIRETDAWADGSGWGYNSATGEKLTKFQVCYRPLSSKKAKRKAKKVESGTKSVLAWAFADRKTGLIAVETVRSERVWTYKIKRSEKLVRVEIRPLVTRKKGK